MIALSYQLFSVEGSTSTKDGASSRDNADAEETVWRYYI